MVQIIIKYVLVNTIFSADWQQLATPSGANMMMFVFSNFDLLTRNGERKCS